MKRWVYLLLFIATFGARASNSDVITMQCGGFKFEAIPEAMNKINGQTVTSQKITMLGEQQTGMKIEMGLMPASDGNNYGFEYIHYPNSNERFLNVQLLQNNMDEPKVIGSFPCKKVAG